MSAAQTFANGATRRRHVAAAQDLRLPYWDWARPPAAGDSVLPSLFTTQRVAVEMPSGTTEIDNPLYQFNFGEMPAPGGAGFSTVTHVCETLFGVPPTDQIVRVLVTPSMMIHMRTPGMISLPLVYKHCTIPVTQMGSQYSARCTETSTKLGTIMPSPVRGLHQIEQSQMLT